MLIHTLDDMMWLSLTLSACLCCRALRTGLTALHCACNVLDNMLALRTQKLGVCSVVIWVQEAGPKISVYERTYVIRTKKKGPQKKLEKKAKLQIIDNVLALAHSVCLLALSHSDRLARVLLLCAELFALCCACGRCSTTQSRRSRSKNKRVYNLVYSCK